MNFLLRFCGAFGKKRNLKLWQQKIDTNTQIIERATLLLDVWRTAQCVRNGSVVNAGATQNEASRSEIPRWEKSTRGRYKCNIDALFSSSLNNVGLEMCICDDEGKFVLVKIEWFTPLCEVDIGEVVGLHTTLE